MGEHDYSAQPQDQASGTMSRSELTPQMISEFEIARVHREHKKSVSCLDASQDGMTMVSSGVDDNIVVYNTLDGNTTGNIPVQKYGAGVVRFIKNSSPTTVVTASTNTDNKIRALDVERKKYIRYFDAHVATVVSIAASPVCSDFLSTSRDSYVMLWDSRKEDSIGKVRAAGVPIVAYDPKGLIFGIAYNAPNLKTLVKLYDARNYDDGPFLEFPLDNLTDSLPNCLKFSSDGEYFLLSNAEANAKVSVFDAYKGACFRSFTGHRNDSGIPLEASFSPNSSFVSTGSDDGSIYIWDLQTEKLLLEKKSAHPSPSTCTIWNPVYAVFASACQNVAFWLPPQEDQSVNY